MAHCALIQSQTLVCLSSLSDNVADICKLNVDAYVLDGAVIVQMVQPGCNTTFDEYRENIFISVRTGDTAECEQTRLQ